MKKGDKVKFYIGVENKTIMEAIKSGDSYSINEFNTVDNDSECFEVELVIKRKVKCKVKVSKPVVSFSEIK